MWRVIEGFDVVWRGVEGYERVRRGEEGCGGVWRGVERCRGMSRSVGERTGAERCEGMWRSVEWCGELWRGVSLTLSLCWVLQVFLITHKLSLTLSFHDLSASTAKQFCLYPSSPGGWECVLVLCPRGKCQTTASHTGTRCVNPLPHLRSLRRHPTITPPHTPLRTFHSSHPLIPHSQPFTPLHTLPYLSNS